MEEKTTTNQPLIERLFAAGSHFGFQKSRRHPTVVPYIFGAKHGTDIFDLEKTSTLLDAAKEVMKKAGSQGKTVLFVGTKDEASAVVKEMAEKAEMPMVINRWIGGMLTNFGEIKRRLARLEDLVSQGESGELERKYTKKERVLIKREMEKLMFNFGGIRTLKKTPDLMVVVDPRHDSIAVTEAKDALLMFFHLPSKYIFNQSPPLAGSRLLPANPIKITLQISQKEFLLFPSFFSGSIISCHL